MSIFCLPGYEAKWSEYEAKWSGYEAKWSEYEAKPQTISDNSNLQLFLVGFVLQDA